MRTRSADARLRRVMIVLLTACLAAGSMLLPARIAVAGSSDAVPATPSRVKVALIDTGVRVDRLAVGATVEPGRNYAFPDKDTTDLVGHGTRIAGIILGIAPDVTLVPLVYYSQYLSGVPVNGGIDAITRAIYDAVDVFGCKVVNVSSGVATDNPSLREATLYAEEKGVIVVSAVGNDRITAPDKVFYPAAYDTVVGVGAVDAELTIAPFSQVNDSVTVVAPGKDIRGLSIRGGSPSETVSGTSYATAYVAAHAALFVSSYPEATPADFRDLLRVSSQDLGEIGFDDTYGWGYVDAGSPSALLAYERLQRVKALPFSDVSILDWYCDAVAIVYEKGLMLGESATAFGPNSPVTWEMLAAALRRLDPQFVPSLGDPAASVSREEVCAILVNYGLYAGLEGYTATAPTNSTAQPVPIAPSVPVAPPAAAVFSDIGQVSDWALDYIKAAQAAGLIRGDGDGLFRPNDAASRAELATMFMRLLSRE